MYKNLNIFYRRHRRYTNQLLLTMKLTLFLTFLLSLQSVAAVRAQRLSIHVNKQPVKDVLFDIQKKTGYDFLYVKTALLDTKPVTINLDNASLKEVLDLCTQDQPISYEINESTVFIKRKVLPSSQPSNNQSPLVQGSVRDAAGKALAGVSIVDPQNQRYSATTDANGKFEITVGPQTKTLLFSFIGFKTKRINVSEGPVVVILEQEVSALDEVVVVGYGELKKKEITSAVTSVKQKDFNQGTARSPLELIQGKVAGLNITRNQGNNPNSGASIQLRGITSLTGTTSPLIVIDGIPGGNLDLLQQDDIESFDVLKDGSAAAIYGTRGNAGVILITTKKGKAGEPTFNYNSYVQRDFVTKRPDVLSAETFRQKIAEGIIGQSNDYGGNTHMYNELINKQNISHYHNLAASGGSEKANYRGSLYYNNFQGIAKENEREQIGGRLNFNQKGMQGKLDLQVNLVTNFNTANLLGGNDFEQAVKWNPTAPVIKEDGKFFEMQENYNPIARYATRESERNQQTFSGDARLTAHILDNLTASFFASYLRDNWNDRNYRSMLDWDQRVGTSWNGMGYASKKNELSYTKTFEPTVNYNLTIHDDHTLNAVAGYSYQYSTYESFDASNNGFTTDGFLDWNLGAGSAIQNTLLPRPGLGSFKDDNTLIAFFGRVNYSYANKYYAQFILRHEGSSRFGANNKWGNFPAASIGWAISEESFMKDIALVNSLKLRAGFGVTGNQGIPNYQSLTTLSTGGLYPQDNVYYQTYGPARNPNPDLRWERKEEWNIGLDYALLNQRLSGSIDVYTRNTRDLLYNYTAQQPPFVRSSLYTNVGTIKNNGVEIAIQAIPVKKEDFQWQVNLTANSQFNRLTKLSSDVFKANWLNFADIPNPGAMGPAIRVEEGGTIGNFYGKRFAKFDEQGKWMFYKADGSIVPSAQITEEDWTVIGNGVPKYVVGLAQTFRYKGFDLNLLLRGKFAFDILNLPEVFYGNRSYLPNNIYNSTFSRHKELNDAPQYSSYYIERGDFVRLDNLTLGYNFKTKGTYIKNLRLYLSGRNLMTITGYKGLDPEVRDIGFEAGVDARGFYPRTQSWTFGLNMGF